MHEYDSLQIINDSDMQRVKGDDDFDPVELLELSAALYEQPEIAVNTTPVSDARP